MLSSNLKVLCNIQNHISSTTSLYLYPSTNPSFLKTPHGITTKASFNDPPTACTHYRMYPCEAEGGRCDCATERSRTMFTNTKHMIQRQDSRMHSHAFTQQVQAKKIPTGYCPTQCSKTWHPTLPLQLSSQILCPRLLVSAWFILPSPPCG